jgi:hypothetical protein
MLSPILKAGVVGAAIFALIALIVLILRTFSFRTGTPYAKSRGGAGRGIFYAFTSGMMPWAKESVSKHLPTFVAGIIYHLGILAAFINLIILLISIVSSPYLILALRVVLLAGFLCGSALLIKRAIKATMRVISTPDDFMANLFVDFFIFGAFLTTFSPLFEDAFYIITIITFLYMPIGKIRHCFFFFYTRILFGTFFGRRGVLPHPARRS